MLTDASQKSPLALAIEQQPRHVKCFKLDSFFGAGGRGVNGVAIWVARKGEDNASIVAAHKYVTELAKSAGEGAAAAKSDAGLLVDTKTIELLYRVCRAVDPASMRAAPDDPAVWKVSAPAWAAFPGPGWMHEHLTTDQLALLLNLYLEVRKSAAPDPGDISDEAVEAVVSLCDTHARDDIPEAALAALDRTKLTHIVVLISAKLVAARATIEELLRQIELLDPGEDTASVNDAEDGNAAD